MDNSEVFCLCWLSTSGVCRDHSVLKHIKSGCFDLATKGKCRI